MKKSAREKSEAYGQTAARPTRKTPPVRSLARFMRLLRANLPDLVKTYQVQSLGIFGSYVRGDQKPRSDLDLLVEFSPRASRHDRVSLQDHLSDLLGVKVDLVPRHGLRPRIGKNILAEVRWLLLDGVQVQNPLRRTNGKRNGATMKPKREFLDFVEDMLKGMDRVQQFTAGFTLEQLIGDEMRLSAVAREIEVIGEAARRIPADVRKRHSQIPWKEIVGMRDKIVHGYFDISYEQVWEVVTKSIPRDKPLVEEMLEAEKRRAGEQSS